jgi:hypothetical protein
MRKLYLVPGTTAPDTKQEQVRKRLRKMRVRDDPQCARCAGREWITATIGNVKSKLCVGCLSRGERVVMD